jgi:hypothetical protein
MAIPEISNHKCVHETDFNELYKRSDEKKEALERIEHTLETKDLKNGFTRKETEKDIDELAGNTRTLYQMTKDIQKSVSTLVIESDIQKRVRMELAKKEDKEKQDAKDAETDEHIKGAWWNDTWTLRGVMISILAIGIAIGIVIRLW